MRRALGPVRSGKIRFTTDTGLSTVSCRCFAFALPLLFALPTVALGQGKQKNKPDKEPPTQTLPAEVDLPQAVIAETARLTFHVSPLSNKGLLLQQTRDALKALMQANHGARIVKLRAFVAGTGDARRVRQIVSEVLADKKKPLPALTTIQVGELPKDGAQVVMESVSEEAGSRAANPGGLAFFPALPANDPNSAVQLLASAAAQAGVAAGEMVRVTCFWGSGEGADAVSHSFPMAAINMVQRLRVGSGPSACEGVGRLKGRTGTPIKFTGGAAQVTAPKLVFTGAQMAFGDKDADLRLAFARLKKAMEPFGTTYEDVVFTESYPVSRAAEERLPSLGREFFPNPGAATTLILEGLPSPDARMSMEVIAAVKGGP
jgi:enamine deaminase RidA (YjgF/YER057c/UK114 family)